MPPVTKVERKLVALPSKKKDDITVMLCTGVHIFIGKPVYLLDEESGEQYIASVQDAFMGQVIHTPKIAQDPISGTVRQEGISVDVQMYPMGIITEIGNDVVIAELTSNSPFYRAYIAATTGIDMYDKMPSDQPGVH